jgi:hypothetical protein
VETHCSAAASSSRVSRATLHRVLSSCSSRTRTCRREAWSTAVETGANRIGVSGGRSLTRRFATPADSPPLYTKCSPLTKATRTPRERLGFVYRSRAIFCRPVPNLNVTIRNLFPSLYGAARREKVATTGGLGDQGAYNRSGANRERIKHVSFGRAVSSRAALLSAAVFTSGERILAACLREVHAHTRTSTCSCRRSSSTSACTTVCSSCVCACACRACRSAAVACALHREMLPRPALTVPVSIIPKQRGMGFNETYQHLCFEFQRALTFNNKTQPPPTLGGWQGPLVYSEPNQAALEIELKPEGETGRGRISPARARRPAPSPARRAAAWRSPTRQTIIV